MTSVYLASCDRYDPDAIARHVQSASDALGVALPRQGSALLHASLPWSHPRYAPHAHTHPAVLEGIARALEGSSVSIGAQSLPGFPTRYSFGKAGYDKLSRRIGAGLMAFDEGDFRSVSSARAQGSTFPLPAGRLDAKAEPGQQTTEDLDHDRQAIALIPLGAADRQQGAALAKLARVGRRPAVAVDDPARRHRCAAGDGQCDFPGGGCRCRHVEVERPLEVGARLG